MFLTDIHCQWFVVSNCLISIAAVYNCHDMVYYIHVYIVCITLVQTNKWELSNHVIVVVHSSVVARQGHVQLYCGNNTS